jgi:hypothetical protein
MNILNIAKKLVPAALLAITTYAGTASAATFRGIHSVDEYGQNIYDEYTYVRVLGRQPQILAREEIVDSGDYKPKPWDESVVLSDAKRNVNITVSLSARSGGNIDTERYLNFSLPGLSEQGCQLDRMSDTSDMQRAEISCTTGDGEQVRYEIVVDGGGVSSPTIRDEVVRMDIIR